MNAFVSEPSQYICGCRYHLTWQWPHKCEVEGLSQQGAILHLPSDGPCPQSPL